MSTNYDLKTFLTPDDVSKLIDAATNLRDQILIRILFFTGCRVSEILHVKVTDIDFDNGYMIIDHLKRVERRECPSCSKKVGQRTLYCPYCGTKMKVSHTEESHKRRFIPLGSVTLAMIRDYLDRRSIQSDLLIPLCRQYVDVVIKNAAYNAGFGGKLLFNPEGKGLMHQVSAHKLRDAFAMEYSKKKNTTEGLKALQMHLGHASFATTTRYLKLDPSTTKEMYDDVFPDA